LYGAAIEADVTSLTKNVSADHQALPHEVTLITSSGDGLHCRQNRRQESIGKASLCVSSAAAGNRTGRGRSSIKGCWKLDPHFPSRMPFAIVFTLQPHLW